MCINCVSANTHHLLAQFAALTEEEKLRVELGRAYGQPLELEEGVSLSKIQGMGRRARVGESHGISVTALHDLKCFVRDHEAPKLLVRDMKPMVAYAVQPEEEFLEEHDICGMRLGICAVVTRESLLSLLHHIEALRAAGFDVSKLALDYDGKWKLIREGWVFISMGGRMLVKDTKDGCIRQTFVPFIWLVCPGERWDYFVFGMLALEVCAYVHQSPCINILHRQLHCINTRIKSLISII